MGGSFDPIHTAHVALAEVALAALSLDEVRWIPVGHAWQKSRALTPAAHRLAMVREATAHESRFVLDAIEVQREGPSYTLDTVRALQALPAMQGAQCFLVMGQDQFSNLPTWHGWQELVQRVTLAVACRGHEPLHTPPALQALPHTVVTLPMPHMNVSSTDIRARLGRGEDPASLAPTLVSPGVARYIAHHQLYAPGAPR